MMCEHVLRLRRHTQNVHMQCLTGRQIHTGGR